MSKITQITIPVLNETTGALTDQTFDIGGGDFDPTITSPADGQILKYDAALGAWVNAGLTARTTSIGSASAGTAIPADDITAWTTNTPTAVSVDNEKLIITAGTAASLSYTAKSIPNISVSNKTVVTGIS